MPSAGSRRWKDPMFGATRPEDPANPMSEANRRVEIIVEFNAASGVQNAADPPAENAGDRAAGEVRSGSGGGGDSLLGEGERTP